MSNTLLLALLLSAMTASATDLSGWFIPGDASALTLAMQEFKAQPPPPHNRFSASAQRSSLYPTLTRTEQAFVQWNALRLGIDVASSASRYNASAQTFGVRGFNSAAYRTFCVTGHSAFSVLAVDGQPPLVVRRSRRQLQRRHFAGQKGHTRHFAVKGTLWLMPRIALGVAAASVQFAQPLLFAGALGTCGVVDDAGGKHHELGRVARCAKRIIADLALELIPIAFEAKLSNAQPLCSAPQSVFVDECDQRARRRRRLRFPRHREERLRGVRAAPADGAAALLLDHEALT